MPKSLTYTLSEVIAQGLLSSTPSTYLSNFMHWDLKYPAADSTSTLLILKEDTWLVATF